MEIVYVYTKLRKEFGRHSSFEDFDAEVLADIQPDEEVASRYITRNPQHVEVQCAPSLSESAVNTERKEMRSHGVNHVEGGWPKDIDSSEQDQKDRYTKKVLRDEGFVRHTRSLVERIDNIVSQNNALDIYEEYFAGEYVDHSSEPPSARTVTVFRDPSEKKRAATHISWYPTDGKKIAVAYSVLQFQQMPEGMSLSSYIWDLSNPNYPEQELIPASPVVCLEYNTKDPHLIVGGCYNAYWDTRKGSSPYDSSIIERSHRDPVYDLKWLQSKTGTEFMSCSTDGQVLFWDIRKLGEPTEILALELKDDLYPGTLGAVSLDYDPQTAGPAKYMVGTEQGFVLTGNRKARSPADRISQVYSGHHGPVYGVARNPFATKYFLTVGDWTARVWVDDITSPIMTTKYHTSYLTCGAWSPTRPGVFFTTKMDGTLDVWDYFYKQNDPVLTLQVSDAGLHTLKMHPRGKVVAVGSLDGSTSLLEVNDGLSVIQPGEKQSIQQMFDREMRREKNLEQRAKEVRQKKKMHDAKKAKDDDVVVASDTELKDVETDFFNVTAADKQESKKTEEPAKKQEKSVEKKPEKEEEEKSVEKKPEKKEEEKPVEKKPEKKEEEKPVEKKPEKKEEEKPVEKKPEKKETEKPVEKKPEKKEEEKPVEKKVEEKKPEKEVEKVAEHPKEAEKPKEEVKEKESTDVKEKKKKDAHGEIVDEVGDVSHSAKDGPEEIVEEDSAKQ